MFAVCVTLLRLYGIFVRSTFLDNTNLTMSLLSLICWVSGLSKLLMAPTRRSKSVNKRVAYTSEVASKKKAENADRSRKRVSSCLVQRINLFNMCPNIWSCTLICIV